MSSRDKLLEAANAVFPTLPYSVASVSAILERAGVQAPTMYHHFGDKEGLYLAWVESSLEHLGLMIGRALATEFPMSDRLVNVAKILLQPGHPDPLQIRRDASMMKRSESAESLYRRVLAAVYDPLLRALLASVQAGHLRTQPVDRMAHVFVVTVLSFRPPYALQPVPIDEAAAFTAEAFMTGFATRR